MRKFIAFVPALALMAQSQSTQPIPTQFPPVRIEPIPTQIPEPQRPRPVPEPGLTIRGPQIGPAVPVHRMEPQYTAEARAAGLQGTVSLYVEVDRNGRPSEVKVMEGLGLGLDEEAVNTVRQWEYEPDRGARDRIQDAFEVDVPFRLDTPAPWFVSSEYYTFSGQDIQRYGEIVRPAPVRYVAPDAAACLKAGTMTVVHLIVGKDGVPHHVRGDGAFGQAPVKAVESWQFKPARGKGAEVEATGQVEFACQPADGAQETPPIEAPRYRVGGSVSAPVLLSKTEPEYSDEARQAKLQGTSMLSVRISPAGKATEIHIIKRLGMGLDRKAIEAVKHWRFNPAMKGGTPVTVEATIEVNFRLL